MTEDEPGHDRADPVDLEQGGARGVDGVGDPLPCSGDLPIQPADIGQQLESEAFTFDGGDTVGVDARAAVWRPGRRRAVVVLHQR